MKKRMKMVGCVSVLLCLCLLTACQKNPSASGPDATSSRDQESPFVGTLKQALPPGTSVEIVNRWQVEDFDKDLLQFKTVFWEAEDSVSLRKLIRTTDLVSGKRVLEIGTGTGLISLCCLKSGARSVVATDINPQAVANARYNWFQLDLGGELDVRLVDVDHAGAFEVVAEDERFDVIISNPPWEDGTVDEVEDYAFIDTRFELLESILSGLDNHLTSEGEAYLAYGCVAAIREVYRRAARHGLRVEQLDDRSLEELENLFLPGMLLKVTRK